MGMKKDLIDIDIRIAELAEIIIYENRLEGYRYQWWEYFKEDEPKELTLKFEPDDKSYCNGVEEHVELFSIDILDMADNEFHMFLADEADKAWKKQLALIQLRCDFT